jgi:AhpD family alkylhydroperoxidase
MQSGSNEEIKEQENKQTVEPIIPGIPGIQRPASYSMINPRMKRVYFNFYREAYTNRGAALSHKDKELISIAASIIAGCEGCLKGHIKKAIKDGATKEEMQATINVAMRVNREAILYTLNLLASDMTEGRLKVGDEKSMELIDGSENKQPKTSSQSSSYSLLDPKMRLIFGDFHQEVYEAEEKHLDRKTQELISIAASLIAKCQGGIEDHIQRALHEGASKEEISETIAIALAINAAAVVDLTDIAANNLNLNFYPSEGPRFRE